MPKEFDPDDPMELVGVELPEGDPDLAIEEIVLEYLFMGWKPAQILVLFRSPHFGATHRIYRLKGHDYVNQRILALAEQWSRGWLTSNAMSLPKEGECNA
ncbi:MAG: hypothetical protein HY666_06165 [Chloroflexi bacterium]|nr:hypothetical protein [Chloroflexota bacterium]